MQDKQAFCIEICTVITIAGTRSGGILAAIRARSDVKYVQYTLLGCLQTYAVNRMYSTAINEV